MAHWQTYRTLETLHLCPRARWIIFISIVFFLLIMFFIILTELTSTLYKNEGKRLETRILNISTLQVLTSLILPHPNTKLAGIFNCAAPQRHQSVRAPTDFLVAHGDQCEAEQTQPSAALLRSVQYLENDYEFAYRTTKWCLKENNPTTWFDDSRNHPMHAILRVAWATGQKTLTELAPSQATHHEPEAC